MSTAALPLPLPPPLPPVPAPAPRKHSDDDLAAALALFAEDHVARLAADRREHGGDFARMAACSRLAKYYTLMHTVCEEAADRWRKGEAP